MTNETTASQPKSIGDDALYGNAMKAARQWARVEHQNAKNLGAGGPGKEADVDRAEESFRAALDAMFDSRAPADQASATIQAAPDTGKLLRYGCMLTPGDQAYMSPERYGEYVKLSDVEALLAATIQEPIMVAEPVGAAKPYSCETGQIDEALADFLAEHTRLNQDGIDTHAMNMTLALNYAAISPTPAEEIARWREQGYLPVAAPMVADPAGVDRDGRMSDELRKMIEGMSVSVDVSTGDDDAGNRYFGTVNEVMDGYHGEKHGVVLLIQDPEPNFDLAATVKAVPSEALDPSEVQTIAERIRNSNFAAPLADKTGGAQ